MSLPISKLQTLNTFPGNFSPRIVSNVQPSNKNNDGEGKTNIVVQTPEQNTVSENTAEPSPKVITIYTEASPQELSESYSAIFEPITSDDVEYYYGDEVILDEKKSEEVDKEKEHYEIEEIVHQINYDENDSRGSNNSRENHENEKDEDDLVAS